MKVNFLLVIICSILGISACSTKQIQKDFTNNASAKECVEYVIAMDESLGTIRNNASKKQSISETIDDYIYSLDNLSFSNCPSAFTAAFEEHMNAWINITEVTDNYPDLRGEMHDIFDIIENGPDSTAFKFLLTDIWATWEQVEQAMNLE